MLLKFQFSPHFPSIFLAVRVLPPSLAHVAPDQIIFLHNFETHKFVSIVGNKVSHKLLLTSNKSSSNDSNSPVGIHYTTEFAKAGEGEPEDVVDVA